jgi:hypothetical protein
MLIRSILTPVYLVFFASAALAAGEPWSVDFSPPPGKYSWVQLDTAEWLKGDIIALYDDTLVFDSDHFGNMDIDLDDVRNVHARCRSGNRKSSLSRQESATRDHGRTWFRSRRPRKEREIVGLRKSGLAQMFAEAAQT